MSDAEKRALRPCLLDEEIEAFRNNGGALRLNPSEYPIQRVARLVDQRFGVVRVGMEIFEGQVAFVANSIEWLDDRRPVGGAVEQRAETLK